ncbi:hypothetical protein HMPREF1988_02234 [Porphyromonas gingivalis F0185]|nr:hypothetical protein HMPREF1988_02234 [Porphyromonas gingivalis F0185]
MPMATKQFMTVALVRECVKRKGEEINADVLIMEEILILDIYKMQ